VGLAQALIHDPEILILDEPTSGLDPNQITEIRKLIRQIGKEKTGKLLQMELPVHLGNNHTVTKFCRYK
jgi:ABC-2 type transport system ATP-binding protein